MGPLSPMAALLTKVSNGQCNALSTSARQVRPVVDGESVAETSSALSLELGSLWPDLCGCEYAMSSFGESIAAPDPNRYQLL